MFYLPLIEVIQKEELPRAFPEFTLTDLYLYVSEYRWLRREEKEGSSPVKAAEGFTELYVQAPVNRIIQQLNTATWIDDLIMAEERSTFLEKTRLDETRPQADVVVTLAGKYDKLLEHISVHRYYLGEKQNGEVTFVDAAASWYDKVYLPKIKVIQELGTLAEFPHRTEADLYLWIMDRQIATADLISD